MRFLFVDRILELVPGEHCRGIKHVTSDDVYLYQDEQGRFCFAPSLIGESLGQLAAWNVMSMNGFRHRPVAGVVASASLHRPVYLGETIFLESFIERLDEHAVQYHSIASVGSEQVFKIQGALGPLLPMQQFIAEDLVERQFKEIHRPGDWPSLLQSYTEDSSQVSMAPTIMVPMVFDRILQSEPGVSLLAEKRITGTAPYFPDHFPYNPVLPMTILLECQLNLAHIFLKNAAWSRDKYQITEFQKIKMNDFIKPGDIVTCQQQVLREDEDAMVLRNRCEVAGKRVCVADIVISKILDKTCNLGYLDA